MQKTRAKSTKAIKTAEITVVKRGNVCGICGQTTNEFQLSEGARPWDKHNFRMVELYSSTPHHEPSSCIKHLAGMAAKVPDLESRIVELERRLNSI
jgi:hypothetical protein